MEHAVDIDQVTAQPATPALIVPGPKVSESELQALGAAVLERLVAHERSARADYEARERLHASSRALRESKRVGFGRRGAKHKYDMDLAATTTTAKHYSETQNALQTAEARYVNAVLGEFGPIAAINSEMNQT